MPIPADPIDEASDLLLFNSGYELLRRATSTGFFTTPADVTAGHRYWSRLHQMVAVTTLLTIQELRLPQ
ncbi:MAG: hypothetical protein R3C20_20495 [Planctomycetaceae bacterium]